MLTAVLSLTPQPITANRVSLTWITQPETSWINIYDTHDTVGLAQAVTGGITNTVTISGTEGMAFVIQEYRNTQGHLELVMMFTTDATPHVDFTTQTPTPILTPIATPLQTDLYQVYTSIVMR